MSITRPEKLLPNTPANGDVYTHIRSGGEYVVVRVVLDGEEASSGLLWKSTDPLVLYRSTEDEREEQLYGRPLTEFVSRFVPHQEKNG